MSITRRALLRFAGILSAAAAVPVRLLASVDTVFTASLVQTGIPAPRREPLEALTAAEAEILEAIVARLIPTDASGPGAAEARAAHYIDRALGGALTTSRPLYAAGLAALDEYARASKGASFKELFADNQDAVLTEVEKGAAAAKFAGASTAFFNMVRAHTIQGTFCDPHYGGNAKFVGWDLLGYPGVRTSVTADQQRMGVVVGPNHQSAYDYPMFAKPSGRI